MSSHSHDSIVLKSLWVSDLVYLSMWFGGRRKDVLFKCESPITNRIQHGVRAICAREEKESIKDNNSSLFRCAVHCFMTHGGNWRPSCWQRRSTPWQHQASEGVGQQVGQRDTMSDESRAEWGQRSRGGSGTWPVIITNRTGSGIKLHRDKRGENRTDLREDSNCRPGWRVKETEREEG